jgi:hypothetical protein
MTCLRKTTSWSTGHGTAGRQGATTTTASCLATTAGAGVFTALSLTTADHWPGDRPPRASSPREASRLSPSLPASGSVLSLSAGRCRRLHGHGPPGLHAAAGPGLLWRPRAFARQESDRSIPGPPPRRHHRGSVAGGFLTRKHSSRPRPGTDRQSRLYRSSIAISLLFL